MTEYGFIRDVRYVTFGTYLNGDALTGTSLLMVEDASDFDEAGGVLTIEETQYDYLSADLENDTITLRDPLDTDYFDSEPITPYPLMVEKQAVVLQDNSDEALSVRVPHNLFDRLAEGMRDEGVGEPVSIELIDGEWVIDDILGQDVVIDGTYIDPTTLPTPPDPTASDDSPPGFSPTPTVDGGIGSLFIRWPGVTNHDQVSYEVHVSTVDGFTPNSTTLINETLGTSMNVRTLTNGTPIQYGTTYFVKIVARDVDGPAPESNEVTGSPVQVSTADIAADYVYAGTISVNNLTGGTLTADLTLAARIKTAESGGRVEMGNDGIIVYKPDNTPATVLSTSGDSTFKGNVEAQSLTVLGGASFRSDQNEVTPSGIIRLATGVTQSKQAPTAVATWAQTPLKNETGGNLGTAAQTMFGLNRTPDGLLVAAQPSAFKVWRWNTDGSFNSTTTMPDAVVGATRPVSGGSDYGLYTDSSAWYLKRYAATSITTDDFSTLSNWTVIGTATVDTGRGKLTLPSGGGGTVRRSLSGNFRSRGISMKVALPTMTTLLNATMRVFKDVNNSAEIDVTGNTITYKVTVAGGITSTSGTYDPVNMAYWRIREQDGFMRFETSADGVAWDWQSESSHTFTDTTLTGMQVEFVGTNSASGPNIINGTFESNLTGWSSKAAPTSSPTVTGAASMSRSTAYAWSGTHSMKLVNNSNYKWASVYCSQTEGTVNPVAVTIMWKNEQTSGVSGQLGVNIYDQSGNAIVTMTAGKTAWQGLTFTVTGGFYIGAGSGINSSTGKAVPLYIDNVVGYEQGGGGSVDMFLDSFVYESPVAEVAYKRINANQSPFLASYGGNLQIVEFNATTKKYHVATMSPDTMAITSTWDSAVVTATGPVVGFARTVADIGTDSYWIADASQTMIYPYNVSTGAAVTNYQFDAVGGGYFGLTWDGSNFYSFTTDGNRNKHESSTVWTTETNQWRTGFTWATASYETPLSNELTFTMKKRARLTITSPALPTSGSSNPPDRIKVYVTRDATEHYQATTAAGVTSVTLTSINFAGAAPPVVSTFPDGVPAKIVSSDSSLVISADGTMQTKGLIAMPKDNAAITAGNRPALIVGDPTAYHLRIDGDDVLAMSGDATQTSLYLNRGGTVYIDDLQAKNLPFLNLSSVTTQNITSGSTVTRTGWTGEFTKFTGLGSGKYAPNESGIYNISGEIGVPGTTTTNVRYGVNVAINGTVVYTVNGDLNQRFTQRTFAVNYRLTAGDSVEIQIVSTGMTITTSTNAMDNVWTMVKVGN